MTMDPTPIASLVCVDTETATMQGAPHVIELGAVRIEDGDIVDTFEEFICPVVPIEEETTAIHGITDRDVSRAALAPEVLARFTDWVGDTPMGAHNAPFDARALGFEYARAGMTPPPGAFLDSLPLARRWIPESSDHKLTTLCQMLDLEEGEHHRALADAVWCWKVIEACFERAEEQGGLEIEAAFEFKRRPLTIASRAPKPARMSPRLRPLERALRDRVPVTLLYGEGLSGQTKLDVMPRLLFESHAKGYLEGECARTGELRTYLLQKVRKVLLN